MLISAGVEKFYTFYQYLSALSLCFSFLVVNLIAVYIFARTPFIKGKKSFAALTLCFSSFLFAELALSVAPNMPSVSLWLAVNCFAVFLCSRVFYLFITSIFYKVHRIVSAVLVVEGALFLAIFLADFAGRPLVQYRFFSQIQFGAVSPGPLFFFLLSSSSFWAMMGMGVLVTADVAGSKRKATQLFFFSSVLIFCSFVIHHLLPGNRYIPLFHLSVAVAVVLVARSFIKYNLLGVLLFPLEQVMEHIDMLILVFGEQGKLVSKNRSRFLSLDLGSIGTESDFFRCLADCQEKESGVKDLESLLERSGAYSGKLEIAENNTLHYIEYRAVPVVYLKHHVGRLICLMDITENELSVLELEVLEEKLNIAYEELRSYSKTTLYHEAENERDRLLHEVTIELETALTYLAENVDWAMKNNGQENSIDSCITGAERSLEQIRKTVRALKNPKKGYL